MARVNYIDKICEGCGIGFKTLIPESRFCSISCSKKGSRNTHWKGGVKNKICPTCGKEFMPDGHIKRVQSYCSKKCGKIKELNPNWKGKVSATGSSHPCWKGDNVGIDALHTYIRRLFPKPDKCQMCNDAPPYDLANISNKYKRDVSDWEWLCRKCHMIKDGRLVELIKNGKYATQRRKGN